MSNVTTSSVWNHYVKLPGTSGMAKCVLCKKDYSYKTSTTNLKKHLNYKHSKAFQSGSAIEKQPLIATAGSSSSSLQNRRVEPSATVAIENWQVLEEIAGASSGVGLPASGSAKIIHAAASCEACTSKQNTDADEHQREEPVTRRRYPHTNTKAQKRRTDSTSDLHEVQENMANAITVINRLIKDQHKPNDIEEDEVELYGKLLVKRLRMLSQKECQELMYEIDGIVLNRLHNERDPMSFNNGESVSSPPGSPIAVHTVKRSLSPCSPYTTPAASPGSP